MSFHQWRNNLILDMPMTSELHNPTKTRTENVGAGGGVLHGIFDTAGATPTKLTDRHGYYFDGASDYINVGSSAPVIFGDGSGNDTPFTFLSVAKLIVSGSEYVLFGKQDTAGDREYKWFVNSNTGLTIQILDVGAVDRIGRNTAAGGVYVGLVHTFACTYDASKASSGIRLYINGIRLDTTDNQSGSYGGMVPSAIDALIGANVNGASTTARWGGYIYYTGVGRFEASDLMIKEFHTEMLQELNQI